MKKSDVDYTLYLCTDRDLMRADTVEDAVRQALLGGVTMVQLREKNCSAKEFFETAQRVKKITDQAGVPLIINDRVDIALAVDADGVHVGQSDIPAAEARRLLGPDKIDRGIRKNCRAGKKGRSGWCGLSRCRSNVCNRNQAGRKSDFKGRIKEDPRGGCDPDRCDRRM